MTENQRAKRRERRRAGKREDRPERPFAGVDTEAIDGYLTMISVATEKNDRTLMVNRPGAELTTLRVLEWLCDNPNNWILCGYWFDYDVNMILRDLTMRSLVDLAEKNWTRWRGWHIRHISRRLFSARHLDSKRSFTVWDFASFTQSSFVAFLKQWELAPPETVAEIQRMKDERADFTWEQREEVKAYNLDECRLLAKGAKAIKETSEKAGLPLTSYYGAGSIAHAMLQGQNLAAHYPQEPVPIPLMEGQRGKDPIPLGFYGGRFEGSAVGLFDSTVYCYDINSAYPYATTQLPCLAHGRWVRTETPRGIYLAEVEWKLQDATYGPFPHRRPVGSLCYPDAGRGWYWSQEVEPALSLFAPDLQVIRGLEWQPDCDHLPFHWVHEFAEMRLDYKKRGDPRAQVLKLGLNSIYGKLAQRVGKHRWRQEQWAGMVTASCRGQILSAIKDDPSACLSIATDAIYTSSPVSVPRGAGLGQWDFKPVDWMLFCQGGVYFWPDGHRTRGFDGRSVSGDQVLEAWQKGGIKGEFTAPQRRFIGYRTGLRRVGKWRLWLEEERTISFDPIPRRYPLANMGSWWRTRPPTPEEVEISNRVDLLLWEQDSFFGRWEEAEQPERVDWEGVF